MEGQHAAYISVLSNHTATLANLVGQAADLQKGMTHVIAEVAAVRQQVGELAGRFDRLETFLRSKLNGGERRDPG